MKKRTSVVMLASAVVAVAVAVVLTRKAPSVESVSVELNHSPAAGAPGRIAPERQAGSEMNGSGGGQGARPESIEAEIAEDVEEIMARLSLAALSEVNKNATLAYWRGLTFIPTSTEHFDESAVLAAIEEMPVEVETDQIDSDDIKQMRSKAFAFIKAYSLRSFDDYVALKGGRSAFAPLESSEYNKAKVDALAAMVQQNASVGEDAFSTVFGAFEEFWNVVYRDTPYMDAVSFDVSFIAFREANEGDFKAEKWTLDSPSNALTEYADTIDRMDGAVLYRAAENAVEPQEIFEKNGTLIYCDVLLTTALGDKQPFPAILRFYKDPDTDKWYSAYVAPFYGEDEDFRPLMP